MQRVCIVECFISKVSTYVRVVMLYRKGAVLGLACMGSVCRQRNANDKTAATPISIEYFLALEFVSMRMFVSIRNSSEEISIEIGV